MPQRHWLFKTEPETFSIDDLARSPKQRTFWDGVRNYQARNMLRDEVAVGDLVLVYHSRQEPMAVVGIARVVEAGTPDPTQFDSRSKYHDPKATKDVPRWYGVTLELERRLGRPVTLAEIKGDAALDGMELTRRGSRLSIQRVETKHFERIVALGG